jgi:hypothetical protein
MISYWPTENSFKKAARIREVQAFVAQWGVIHRKAGLK